MNDQQPTIFDSIITILTCGAILLYALAVYDFLLFTANQT